MVHIEASNAMLRTTTAEYKTYRLAKNPASKTSSVRVRWFCSIRLGTCGARASIASGAHAGGVLLAVIAIVIAIAFIAAAIACIAFIAFPLKDVGVAAQVVVPSAPRSQVEPCCGIPWQRCVRRVQDHQLFLRPCCCGLQLLFKRTLI